MVRIVAVHGIGQQSVGANTLHKDWQPVAGHTDYTRSSRIADIGGGVAVVQRAGRAVVLAGAVDSVTYMIDGETGEQAMAPLGAHERAVARVATVVTEGELVALPSGWGMTVRAWSLETDAAIGTPWTGHAHRVRALATGTFLGRLVAVSGSDDRFIIAWELPSETPRWKVDTGTSGEQLVVVRIDDEDAVLSVGSDETPCVLSLRTGRQVRPMLELPGDRIEGVGVASNRHGRAARLVFEGRDALRPVVDLRISLPAPDGRSNPTRPQPSARGPLRQASGPSCRHVQRR